MEWYGPLTVLPAVALLILSTSNFIGSLNSEVFQMEQMKDVKKEIIILKLGQLKRLGIAMALLYISSLLFLVAGISKAILESDPLLNGLMIIGVLSTTLALGVLLIHSLKAVSIRQKHLNI
tara:strand:+ start:76242 stop:76604 length:363 start_codon:yes stop_codon:yes gene_type:complete